MTNDQTLKTSLLLLLLLEMSLLLPLNIVVVAVIQVHIDSQFALVEPFMHNIHQLQTYKLIASHCVQFYACVGNALCKILCIFFLQSNITHTPKKKSFVTAWTTTIHQAVSKSELSFQTSTQTCSVFHLNIFVWWLSAVCFFFDFIPPHTHIHSSYSNLVVHTAKELSQTLQ